MKLFKTITLALCILSFTGTTINAVETDCDNPKGFHQKMVCKIKGSGSSSDQVSSTEEKKTNEGGFLKKIKHKIKTFGGENVGSEG